MATGDIYNQMFTAWPPRRLDDGPDTAEADTIRADAESVVQTTRVKASFRFSFERSMPGRDDTSYAYCYEQDRIAEHRGNA